MSLNKYNNLLDSGRWSNKDTKDAQILALVGVDQNISDDSIRSSKKSNKDTNNVEKFFITYLPHCILEEPNLWVKKPKDKK